MIIPEFKKDECLKSRPGRISTGRKVPGLRSVKWGIIMVKYRINFSQLILINLSKIFHKPLH